jgi:hypothetical protein
MLNKLHFGHLRYNTAMVEVGDRLNPILLLFSPLVVNGDHVITIQVVVLLYHIIGLLPVTCIPKHQLGDGQLD